MTRAQAVTELTNALNVKIPRGADLDSVRTSFEFFGEVAAIEPLPDDGATVEVVYFDVRSAAAAAEAMGDSVCWSVPPAGTREVRLPGHVQFRAEDFASISSVTRDSNSTDFIVQFYDIRDAARYQEKLDQAFEESDTFLADKSSPQFPPGLAPPPGLEAPPGKKAAIGGAGHSWSLGINDSTVQNSPQKSAMSFSTGDKWLVYFDGLPNDLLTDVMFEAVLQQAGLQSAVVTFTTKTGERCGTATVTFSSLAAAERCAKHFHGCKWGTSVEAVSARIEMEEGSCNGYPTTQASSLNFDWCAMAITGMSAQAPAFESELKSRHTDAVKGLSAAAPIFVPGGAQPRAEGASRKGVSATVEKLAVSSDTSTEVGESELEEDKEGVGVGTAASLAALLLNP